MSDQPQGPGWWLASDGRWYPPDQAPAVPPPETWSFPPPGPPPAPGGSGGSKVGLIVGLAVGGMLLLFLLSIIALQFLGTEAERSFSSTGSVIDGGNDDGGGAPSDLPEGYELIEGDGVAIGAPATWQGVDPEDVNMSGDELAEAFPDAPEGYLDQIATFFDQGAVLVAFDFGPGFVSNVNVGDFPGDAPFSAFESQARKEIEALDGEVLESGTTELPAGEAARIHYAIDVTGPDGSLIAAEGVQYYLPLGGRTYVITITVGGAAADLADSMAETFRVG